MIVRRLILLRLRLSMAWSPASSLLGANEVSYSSEIRKYARALWKVKNAMNLTNWYMSSALCQWSADPHMQILTVIWLSIQRRFQSVHVDSEVPHDALHVHNREAVLAASVMHGKDHSTVPVTLSYNSKRTNTQTQMQSEAQVNRCIHHVQIWLSLGSLAFVPLSGTWCWNNIFKKYGTKQQRMIRMLGKGSCKKILIGHFDSNMHWE